MNIVIIQATCLGDTDDVNLLKFSKLRPGRIGKHGRDP
jgi:hypothetical protein